MASNDFVTEQLFLNRCRDFRIQNDARYAFAGESAAIDISADSGNLLSLKADGYFVGGDSSKVDKVDGKQLSTNDYTTEEKTKLDGIESGAQVNTIESITIDGVTQSISGTAVALDLSDYVKAVDVGSALRYKGSVAAFANLPATDLTAGDVYNVQAAGGTDADGIAVKAGDNVVYNGTGWDVLAGTIDISGKVDKVEGKQLSTEDFTTELKTKLETITGGEDNVIESISVNGVGLSAVNGNVNIEFTGGGESNVIESISVNGVAQTITNKNVDLAITAGGGAILGTVGSATDGAMWLDTSGDLPTVNFYYGGNAYELEKSVYRGSYVGGFIIKGLKDGVGTLSIDNGNLIGSGITDNNGIIGTVSGTTVTLNQYGLPTTAGTTVTISDGYTLALGEDVTTSGATWTMTGASTADLLMGAGYTLSDNAISYHDGAGDSMLTYSGITSVADVPNVIADIANMTVILQYSNYVNDACTLTIPEGISFFMASFNVFCKVINRGTISSTVGNLHRETINYGTITNGWVSAEFTNYGTITNSRVQTIVNCENKEGATISNCLVSASYLVNNGTIEFDGLDNHNAGDGFTNNGTVVFNGSSYLTGKSMTNNAGGTITFNDSSYNDIGRSSTYTTNNYGTITFNDTSINKGKLNNYTDGTVTFTGSATNTGTLKDEGGTLIGASYTA